jgi:nucleotide-binding universal stress UspA family protein
MFKNVLVTIDGSELSEQALDYAREIVAPDGVILLLSVVDLPDVTAYGMYPMSVAVDYYDKTMSYAEAGTQDYVSRIADDLRARGSNVRELVAVGDAAERIVAQAKESDVDAIVMTTHGRTGLNQWLFGSVTQKVLSRMPCPVLVIPGRRDDKQPTKPTEADETEPEADDEA